MHIVPYIYNVLILQIEIGMVGDNLAYSEASKKATMKYMKENLDDIKVRVRKGNREKYQKEAKNLGYESFNEFVISAIEEKIKREANKQNKKKVN